MEWSNFYMNLEGERTMGKIFAGKVVGVAGIEPAASCTQGRRSAPELHPELVGGPARTRTEMWRIMSPLL